MQCKCPWSRIDSSVIMWGAVGGGIGMRWKAFAENDVLCLDGPCAAQDGYASFGLGFGSRKQY